MRSYRPAIAWVRNGKPLIDTDGFADSPPDVLSLSATTPDATAAPMRSAATRRASSTTREMTSLRI